MSIFAWKTWTTQMLTGLGPSMTLGPTCQVCLPLRCMLRSPQNRREKTGPMMEPKFATALWGIDWYLYSMSDSYHVSWYISQWWQHIAILTTLHLLHCNASLQGRFRRCWGRCSCSRGAITTIVEQGHWYVPGHVPRSKDGLFNLVFEEKIEKELVITPLLNRGWYTHCRKSLMVLESPYPTCHVLTVRNTGVWDTSSRAGLKTGIRAKRRGQGRAQMQVLPSGKLT